MSLARLGILVVLPHNADHLHLFVGRSLIRKVVVKEMLSFHFKFDDSALLVLLVTFGIRHGQSLRTIDVDATFDLNLVTFNRTRWVSVGARRLGDGTGLVNH